MSPFLWLFRRLYRLVTGFDGDGAVRDPVRTFWKHLLRVAQAASDEVGGIIWLADLWSTSWTILWLCSSTCFWISRSNWVANWWSQSRKGLELYSMGIASGRGRGNRFVWLVRTGHNWHCLDDTGSLSIAASIAGITTVFRWPDFGRDLAGNPVRPLDKLLMGRILIKMRGSARPPRPPGTSESPFRASDQSGAADRPF